MQNSDHEHPGTASLQLLDPSDTNANQRASTLAWLRLHAVLCLDPVAALDALERGAGDPVRALALARTGDPPSLPRLEAWCELLGRRAVRLLPISSPAYPPQLRALPDAPLLLFVQGEPSLLVAPAVAIVGARAATRYGLDVARELAAGLAEAGLCIVSGMARGIDGAAHHGALDVRGATVAIQACGPDQTYPPEHRVLRERIEREGAVLSELPPGSPPRAPFFPLRNRLISGLARLVIVVEARERSGSLITVRHALDQGREVMVVPGPLHAATSIGPNRLLRDGARPVLEVQDVLDALGMETAIAGPSVEAPAAENDDTLTRAILASLEQEPASRDRLGRMLDQPPEQIASRLTTLQLSGRVAQDRDGCLRVRGGLARPSAERSAGRPSADRDTG